MVKHISKINYVRSLKNLLLHYDVKEYSKKNRARYKIKRISYARLLDFVIGIFTFSIMFLSATKNTSCANLKCNFLLLLLVYQLLVYQVLLPTCWLGGHFGCKLAPVALLVCLCFSCFVIGCYFLHVFFSILFFIGIKGVDCLNFEKQFYLYFLHF